MDVRCRQIQRYDEGLVGAGLGVLRIRWRLTITLWRFIKVSRQTSDDSPCAQELAVEVISTGRLRGESVG